jgi:hypothetical protein
VGTRFDSGKFQDRSFSPFLRTKYPGGWLGGERL